MRHWRLLPLAVFLLVLAVHAVWLSRDHPGSAQVCVLGARGQCVEDRPAAAGLTWPSREGFTRYLGDQNHFLGLSYALAAAFTLFAIGQWRCNRGGAVAGAVTGVSLTTVLLVGGCFLVGCCGSPMLPVWLGLFGVKALGLAKPVVALVTALSVALGYVLLRRKCSPGCSCAAGSEEERT